MEVTLYRVFQWDRELLALLKRVLIRLDFQDEPVSCMHLLGKERRGSNKASPAACESDDT